MASATCDFGGLTIAYDERVIAPRPWTLMHSEWAVEAAQRVPPGPILELCAGAGHIGLVVAQRTGRRLVQVEASPIAAQYAQRNASAAGVDDHELRVADIDHALAPDEMFPLIVADPPYVPSAEVVRYPEDPVLAIDGGDDGFDMLRRCIVLADRHLSDSGAVLLQLRGAEQAAHVGEHLVDGTNLELCDLREHDAERAVVWLARKWVRP